MSRGSLLRLLAACALVVSAMGVAGARLVDATLPLLRLGFGALAPEFELRALERRRVGPGEALVAEVSLARPVTVAGRNYRPDPRGTAWSSVPTGHVLLLPSVVAIALLAWPAAGRREWGVRLGVATGAVLPLMTVDIPAVLAAGVWGVFPGGSSRDGWIGAWSAFVSGGGRVAIAVGVVAAALACGRRCDRAYAPRPQPTARPDGADRTGRTPRRQGTPAGIRPKRDPQPDAKRHQVVVRADS